ncbi:MAG: hypothetical protein ABFS37_05765 [Acidobacteriota bacterium]
MGAIELPWGRLKLSRVVVFRLEERPEDLIIFQITQIEILRS